jgi:hypothetical protein
VSKSVQSLNDHVTLFISMNLASTTVLEPQQQLFPKRQQSISCQIPEATATTATTTTVTTTMTATTATAAAGCHQHGFETRQVSSLWYVFLSLFFFYLLLHNVYVRYVATMAATKAGRIDNDNGHDYHDNNGSDGSRRMAAG